MEYPKYSNYGTLLKVSSSVTACIPAVEADGVPFNPSVYHCRFLGPLLNVELVATLSYIDQRKA